MIDLSRKAWSLFGYRGSGKTTLAQYIASSFGANCLYYDTLHEIPDDTEFHAYAPADKRSITELEGVVELIRKTKRYRMFIIDEANRFCKPKPAPLPQGIADMNDWCRHPQYNLSVGYIARRPVQLNQDITEIADYLFVFQLGGKNDIQYLNDLRDGLGDAVKDLPQYHFAQVYPDRTWEIMSPISPPKGKKAQIPV